MDNSVNYINPLDLPVQKEILTRILDIGLKFKCRDRVIDQTNVSDFNSLISKVYEKNVPVKGIEVDKILDKFEKEMLPYCTNWASPCAMAFNDTGNSFAGIAGDVLATLLNQNVINWKPCSPLGTVVEMTVLNWLRQLLGYPCRDQLLSPIDVAGLVTSGGVASNTIATLLAREKASPNAMVNGLKNSQKMVVIVPEGIDHYSSRLSVGWIGIGESNVIKAPTLNFAYDLNKLSSLLKKITNDGAKVIMLVCYAGDSRSMTFDNFIQLRKICDEYGIWLHCDGCQGTQLVFSRRLRQEKLKGIELSDSITMDPHKILNIPYSISVLLIKDRQHLELIRRPEDIITGEEHSFGQLTPFFGSRNFMSLKLYFLIKNLGLDGLDEVIERRCHMANVVSAEIGKVSQLLQINDKIELNSVIFMYFPRAIARQLPSMGSLKDKRAIVSVMNDINVSIQDKLFAAGDIWLHTFLIPDLSNALQFSDDEPRADLRPLRFMSGNPILSTKHISLMISRVVAEGDALLRNYIANMNAADPIYAIFSSFKFDSDGTCKISEMNGGHRINGVNEVNVVNGINGMNGGINGENGMNGGINGENGMNEVCKGFSIRNNDSSIAANDSYYLTKEEFCKRKTELIVQIRQFCSTEFIQPGESYFVVVYGSYGYGFVKPQSDLDIVFYCSDEHCTDDRRSRIITFVKNLHEKHNMQIDNEIPYEFKILLPYSFLKSACNGKGIIETDANGQWNWHIPKILKSIEYLTSNDFLLRFFMGVFLNENFLVSGDARMYNKCKGLSARNLTRAIISINKRKSVSSFTLTKDFCLSPSGEFGDYFLGFSDREPFTSHLLEFLEGTLGTMNLQPTPGKDGTLYSVQSAEDLHPEHFIHV
ncbi:uncharacterized protein LOC119077829 [Bradysia coprophila]|uniref:uncharacterized protein LOC119077829 n=1 Tax=Bradysia coprophila TaxID=38358 RepID=UPI00187DC169|nr:uncharacterized protein LOC119077829 [Bradysia coprophila]